jgi:hypothetical protein
MGWIGGIICFILVCVIAFFCLMAWEKWNEARLQEHLRRFGTVIKGWIVFANDQLYLRNAPTNMWPAQVVFTLHPQFTDVIDVYINALRKKIERPDRGQRIQSIRGVGYTLRSEA